MEQWLEAGLSALELGGVDGLQVERLAKSLSISRSGFYWHFSSRAQFLKTMQEYWAEMYTQRVMDEVNVLSDDPRGQLAEMPRIINSLKATRYDPVMWVWAAADTDVKKLVDRVRDERLRFVRSVIQKCGFRGASLNARTRLFVVYFSWAGAMFDGDVTHGRSQKVKEILDIILAPET